MTTSTGAGGDRESFDAFYEREFPRMVALACAVSGSRTAAEDVAQEALLTAAKRWPVLSTYDNPGAWIRRVTIQLAVKSARRARLETLTLRRWHERSGPAIPEGAADVETVLVAVSRLPARQRAVIALFYLEDRSVTDTAQVLGCAEGTVKAHLFQTRRALARVLGEEEG